MKGKAQIRDGIEFAQQSLTAEPSLEGTEDHIRVIFCVSCFRRNEQLLAAMAINCALWWSMRKYWRLAICTFGEDETTVNEIKAYFRMFIDCGLLVIGSGGEMGNRRTDSGECCTLKWMPRRPIGTSTHEDDEELGMPSLKYWHASTAKNAAHQLANHCWGTNACWVNLDCDQIVPLGYVRSVVTEYAKNREVPGLCIECSGVDGSLTGRLAYRGQDFFAIGGYDEYDTPPSGGQDVDLRLRLGQMAQRYRDTASKAEIKLKGKQLCGFALPNDFANTTVMWDRGQAKTVNVDPAVWRTFGIDQGEKEWDQLRKKGWRVFQKRIKAQETVRNEELLKRQYSIGAWFCVVERNFNIADKELVSDLPPLAQNVVVSPYWTDEPETPVQVPDERLSPRAVELQKPDKITVNLFAIGARELTWQQNTSNTPLGPMHVHVFRVSFTLHMTISHACHIEIVALTACASFVSSGGNDSELQSITTNRGNKFRTDMSLKPVQTVVRRGQMWQTRKISCW